jgi:hypothetical protein
VKNELKDRKGFYYVLEEEKIREYMKIHPRHRLQWLEDANDFAAKALSPEKLRIREKFRSGEI